MKNLTLAILFLSISFVYLNGIDAFAQDDNVSPAPVNIKLPTSATESPLLETAVLEEKAKGIHFTEGERQIQKELEDRLSALNINTDIFFYGRDFFRSFTTSENSLQFHSTLTPSDYILGINDEVQIQIRGVHTEDLNVTIDAQGNIILPNGESVFLVGKSLQEAEALLNGKIVDLYQNVIVKLELQELRKFYVSVNRKKQKIWLVP